jgi:UPF0271 protein
VITDPDAAAEQTLMLLTGHVRTITGRMLPLEVDTVCLHGDTPGAAAIARRVRERLAQARVEVVSLEEVIAGQVS